MKKTLTFMLMLFMLCACCINVFAAENFLGSPSNNQAPELVEGNNVVVTSYSKRDTLADNGAELEAAYEKIATCTDLSSLCADVAGLAKKLKVSVSDLAVSDLFDISSNGSDNSFTITLKLTTADNFAGLLHFHNNTWEVVKDAKVSKDGKLTFTVDSLSPFAVLVSTSAAQPSNSLVWLYVLIAVVAVVAVAVVVFVVLKKKNTKKA